MKMIYETADPKMVIVEIAPEEVRFVYHDGAPEVLFHRAVAERTRQAFEVAGLDSNDIIGSGFDITEEERNAVLAAAV